MKYAIAFVFLIAAVVTSATTTVDWSQVKPLHVELNIPRNPHAAGAEKPGGRITHGQLASPKQFPYQAGLLLYVDGGAAWCGGSVISNRWILTAAHCTDELTTGVDVYLGAWNRQDRTEKNQQIIFVQKRNVIVHEDWKPDVLVNDISLIKLPVTIDFNEYIQPITLPKLAKTYETYSGDMAIASGWGRTSDQAQGATDKLQWVEVPIMSNSGCNAWYLGSIKSTNICIKTTGGKSTCNGDSGGPLVLADTTPHTLVGLTSFGLALGCEVGWPGVFTRVTSYLDWIEKHSGVANK